MSSNIQWGSVAEWITGIITATGIYLALRNNKVRIGLKHEADNGSIEVLLHNKSNFEVQINAVAVKYYKNRFIGGYLGSKTERTAEKHYRRKSIKLRPLGRDSLRVTPHKIIKDLDKDYYYVRYGCAYLGGTFKFINFRRKIKIPKDKKDGIFITGTIDGKPVKAEVDI
ncbi:hypothetical protein [Alkalibacterium pelagium]|uniref:Uncharacterized protein n=1 Tax=Alkalibacterium pelagium TaxID=426702 RepID=A0A1H7IJN9_9LACT|nr:hypothetical protein [Alkalibacterium pelagium]GEN50090.1 hypothetical protein APE02nite_07550 [Alkalibacterium pelagium]SEK61937.1 hypothetical protein SAMN04488099_104137 [Alkalibacterium pelagium]